MTPTNFQELLHTRGRELYRDMPWRDDTRPYYILVSELMLQQTQVNRVIPKFEAFIARFPDTASLAEAPLADVLIAWSGLGYNRRAKYLHGAAKQLMMGHDGEMPNDYKVLQQLPGIGPATAGAIMVYAFNRPLVFIETNVRTVYFHSFFKPEEKVSDAQLVPLIESTIDNSNPRNFYWALMDWGSWLKQNTITSRNSQSAHYKKQTRFSGSLREMRGKILRLLSENEMTLMDLREGVWGDERFSPALDGLVKDGLVAQTNKLFYLTK